MGVTVEGYMWDDGRGKQGLTTDAVVPSDETLQDGYDVCIIGAGFAGLTAARDLTSKGHRVLIVEARDRVGGRTWTAKEQGETFEMGGTWVLWSQPHVYREICRYGLEGQLKTSSGTAAAEQIIWRPAEGPLQLLDVQERTAIMEHVAKQCFAMDGLSSRDLMPFPHDPLREPAPWKAYDHLSWRGRLDMLTGESQSSRDLLETEFNTIGGDSGSKIGFVEALRWYALGGHTMEGTFEMAGTFKLGGGGMTSLAMSILRESKSDIVTRTIVTTIQQDADGTTIIAEAGRSFRARYCICTIPLNVLSTINFQPPLAALRTEAIQDGHINKGTKFHMRMGKTPAWFATAENSSGSPFCFAFTDHDSTSTSSSANKTFAFAFGYNDRIPDMTDHQFITSSFRQSMNSKAHVEAYLTHDWPNDPFAKGTWCCWGPRAMSRYLAALQEPHGKVLMASADWANGYRGFVDGAIERGAKAAQDAHGLLLAGGASSVRASKLA